MLDDSLTRSLCEGLLGGNHGHAGSLEEGGPAVEDRQGQKQDSKRTTDSAGDGARWRRRESQQRRDSRDTEGAYSEDQSEFTGKHSVKDISVETAWRSCLFWMVKSLQATEF